MQGEGAERTYDQQNGLAGLEAVESANDRFYKAFVSRKRKVVEVLEWY